MGVPRGKSIGMVGIRGCGAAVQGCMFRTTLSRSIGCARCTPTCRRAPPMNPQCSRRSNGQYISMPKVLSRMRTSPDGGFHCCRTACTDVERICQCKPRWWKGKVLRILFHQIAGQRSSLEDGGQGVRIFLLARGRYTTPRRSRNERTLANSVSRSPLCALSSSVNILPSSPTAV